jgi:hypothetical protein
LASFRKQQTIPIEEAYYYPPKPRSTFSPHYTMPRQRRQLRPQSVFDEPALRAWLSAKDAKYEQHVRLIWQQAESIFPSPPPPPALVGSVSSSSSSNSAEKEGGGGGQDGQCTTTTTHCRIADLPKIVQESLPSTFVHCTSRVVDQQWGDHGGKLVIELQQQSPADNVDGSSKPLPHRIETVIIYHPSKNRRQNRIRATVCVSSQVGCRMNCTFCATGTMGKSPRGGVGGMKR